MAVGLIVLTGGAEGRLQVIEGLPLQGSLLRVLVNEVNSFLLLLEALCMGSSASSQPLPAFTRSQLVMLSDLQL